MKREKPLVFTNPSRLIEYVEDNTNGFIRTKTIGEIRFSAKLNPIDYLVCQKRIKENKPELKKEDFEDLQYFDLRIHINEFKREFIKFELEDAQQYSERLDYCAFKMQNDIKLLDGFDTLNCVLFHFERGFDVIPYGHFIIAFPPSRKEMVEAKTIIYNDNLFNSGTIKLSFRPQTLVREPIIL